MAARLSPSVYRVILVSALALAAVASFHLSRGFRSLLFEPDRALDLNMRFQEVHLFWRVPVDLGEHMPAGQMERWDWENYLPSSHILGLVYVPPVGWTAVRWHFAVLTACALAGLVLAGAHFSGASSPPLWLLGPVVLACSNLQTSLAFGQYSIIVAALVVGVGWRLSRDDEAGAAILLVLASVKPALCVPVYVLLIAYRRWRIFLWSAGIVALLLVAGFAQSEMPLREHVSTYVARSGLQMDRGFGLNTVFMVLGLPAGGSKYVGLLLVAAGSWFLARRIPDLLFRDPLAFVALAGFSGRAWFPAFSHDNVLLIPLLMWWLGRAWEDRDRWSVSMLALVGLSLWLPGRWMMLPVVALFQWLAWSVGVVALIGHGVWRAKKDKTSGSA